MNKLIRIRKVQEMVGISKSYIYQLMHTGHFPKPISLVPGGSSVAWVESEVTAWINSRIEERDLS